MNIESSGPISKGSQPSFDPEEDVLSRMMMTFESLGGSGHGCEFGLVQRALGAEPLGLLRWADLGFDFLVAALECEFDGVGSPENTFVFFPNGDESHYWSRDTRFWMAQGAHIPAAKITKEFATLQICRRQQFLRRKLLSDLAVGEKIFVYKNQLRMLNSEEVMRLYRAIRRYGSGTLLYVRTEDAAHVNGMVEYTEPGLMIGYIDHFSHSPTDESLGLPVESWTSICRNAYALWTSAASHRNSINSDERLAENAAEPR